MITTTGANTDTNRACEPTTRRQFLGRLTAATITIGLAAATTALSGCSGASKQPPPDSDYAGSYRAAYSIPSANESGTFSYSVAQKGDIIGSFVDGSSNTTRAFNGHVDNNGTFQGVTTDGPNSYSTSGTISKIVSASTGGDFKQMRSGAEFRGSFSFVTTGVTPPTDSVYAGAYNGSFNLSGQTAAPASFSVDKLGNITGNLQNKSENGVFRGTVNTNGVLNATVAYPSGTATLAGTLVATGNGTPSGNVTQTLNGVTTAGTFGSPIPLPADSRFLGAYRGTFGIPDNSEAGSLSFTIDPSGAMTGFFSGAQTAASGKFDGSIASDGNFVGTILYTTGNPLTTTRTIKGKIAVPAGSTGKLSGDFRVQYVSNGQSVGAENPGNFDVTLGGATDVDSIFRGAYGNAIFTFVPAIAADSTKTPPVEAKPAEPGFVPFSTSAPAGSVPQQAGLSFTVDKEGKFVGSLTELFGNTSTLTGTMANDGRFTATITATTGTYTLSGNISKQNVQTIDQSQSPRKLAFSPGVAADFQVVVNGKSYPGSFQAVGGFN